MLENKPKKKQRDAGATAGGKVTTSGNHDTSGGHATSNTSAKALASTIIRASIGESSGYYSPSSFYKPKPAPLKTTVHASNGLRDGVPKTHPLESTSLPSSSKSWHNQSQAKSKVSKPATSQKDYKSAAIHQISPNVSHLSISTVYTCEFCSKSFSKADLLEKHKKCHKTIITLDSKIIKEGKVEIGGVKRDISPYIKLHNISSSRDVGTSQVHSSQGTFSKYSNIRTYGNQLGSKGFRDTSSKDISKRTFSDLEAIPPLPGESVLSKIRQELPLQGHDAVVSRSQNDSNITIGLALPHGRHAGMKCTYTSKSSNKLNKSNAYFTHDLKYASACDGKKTNTQANYEHTIGGLGARPKLHPLPAPIMSTQTIRSNRAADTNHNISHPNIYQSDGNKRRNVNVAKTRQTETTGKTQVTQLKQTKDGSSEGAKKTTKKQTDVMNAEMGTAASKDKIDAKTKSSRHETETNEGKKSNAQNEIRKSDNKQTNEKPKETSNKVTDELNQIVKEMDLKDKNKFSKEAYERMKDNAWKSGIILPSMVPPTGMARYFRIRLALLMREDRIARVIFEPWDILSAESPSRSRKRVQKKKHDSSRRRSGEKRSRSTRSNSTESTGSSVSSPKRRRRFPSGNSAASDPVVHGSRKPERITKKKSGSVESRNSTKSTGPVERKRRISSASSKSSTTTQTTHVASAPGDKQTQNRNVACSRLRNASTESGKRDRHAPTRRSREGHRSDSEIVTRKVADHPSSLPNIANQEDIVIEHVDDSIMIDDDEEDDERLQKEKLRLRQSLASSNVIKCPLCYFEMGDVTLLRDHMKVHAKIPCPLCDLQFQEVTDLQRHLLFHAENPRDDPTSSENTVMLSPSSGNDQPDLLNTVFTSNASPSNQAIGVICVDQANRLTNRHFMDGLLNLPSSRSEGTSSSASSAGADTIVSTSTADSVLTLKLEDEGNQVVVSQGGASHQVSDSQFVAPQVISAQRRNPHTISSTTRCNQSDFDEPLPIIIPDDSDFKRPACRHVRRRKRPTDKFGQSGSSFYACDDCETDFENEQLQQQIQPLVILSSMSLQSHVDQTNASRLSRVTQQNVHTESEETYQQYQYPVPQPMILDIQPTGATAEDQLILDTLDAQQQREQLTNRNENQMFQGIEYVATIDLPAQEAPVPRDLVDEPRTETTDETTSVPTLKTFSVDEVAKMVRAELDAVARNELPDVAENQADKKSEEETNETLLSKKPASEKAPTKESTVEKPFGENATVEKPTDENSLNEQPEIITIADEPITESRVEKPSEMNSLEEKTTKEKPEQEKLPKGKVPQEKPLVQHVYPVRNPHINHTILDDENQSSESPDEEEGSPNKRKISTRSKKKATALKGKKKSAEMKYSEAQKKVSAKKEAFTSEPVKVFQTRSRTAKNSIAVKSTEEAIAAKPRSIAKDVSNPAENISKETSKTLDRAKQMAIMKTEKEKEDAKRKIKKTNEVDKKADAVPKKQEQNESNKETGVKQKSVKGSRRDAAEPQAKNKAEITRKETTTKEAIVVAGSKADNTEDGAGKDQTSTTLVVKASSKTVDAVKQSVNEEHNAGRGNKSVQKKVTKDRVPDEINVATAPMATTIYEYNGQDNVNKNMDNFLTKQRTKRKRKQMKECIVHLHQLTNETLSTVLSTGSVTLTDDSSIASSEFSKTTDTRLGDDEDEGNDSAIQAASDGSTKKIKKKRKRKPKGYEYSKESGRKKNMKNLPDAGSRTVGAGKVQGEGQLQEVPKRRKQSIQESFHQLTLGKGNSITQLGAMLRATQHSSVVREINNNEMKSLENPLQMTAGTLDPGSDSGTASTIILVPQVRQMLESDLQTRSRISEVYSQTVSNSAASGSESDVDFSRFDRGLGSMSGPEDFTLDPYLTKSNPGAESAALGPGMASTGLRTEIPIQGVQATSKPIHPYLTTPLPTVVSPQPSTNVGAPRLVQNAAQRHTGAIQAALSTTPSSVQGGRPVWPMQSSNPTSPAIEAALNTPSSAVQDGRPAWPKQPSNPTSPAIQAALNIPLSAVQDGRPAWPKQPSNPTSPAIQAALNTPPIAVQEERPAWPKQPSNPTSPAIHATLNTPPSAVQDGRPATTGPKRQQAPIATSATTTVSDSTQSKLSTTAVSLQTKSSVTIPQQSPKLSQPSVQVETAASSAITTETTVSRITRANAQTLQKNTESLAKEGQNSSGGQPLVAKPTKTITTPISPSTPMVSSPPGTQPTRPVGSNVRISAPQTAARTSELKAHRPYGPIHPPRPSGPTQPKRSLGSLQPPRFPGPTQMQSQRMTTPSNVQPTSSSGSVQQPTPSTQTTTCPTSPRLTGPRPVGELPQQTKPDGPTQIRPEGQAQTKPIDQVRSCTLPQQTGAVTPTPTATVHWPSQQPKPIGPTSTEAFSARTTAAATVSVTTTQQLRSPGSAGPPRTQPVGPGQPARTIGPTAQSLTEPGQIRPRLNAPRSPVESTRPSTVILTQRPSATKPRLTLKPVSGPTVSGSVKPNQPRGSLEATCLPPATQPLIATGTTSTSVPNVVPLAPRATVSAVPTIRFPAGVVLAPTDQTQPARLPTTVRPPNTSQTIQQAVSQKTAVVSSPQAPAPGQMQQPRLTAPSSELLSYLTSPQRLFPTALLTPPMPDGSAPPTIIRIPPPPPNTVQVGPVQIEAIPVSEMQQQQQQQQTIQGVTLVTPAALQQQIGPVQDVLDTVPQNLRPALEQVRPTMREIIDSLPPRLQPELEQMIESLPPELRPSFIQIMQNNERIRDQVVRSQIAQRMGLAGGQVPVSGDPRTQLATNTAPTLVSLLPAGAVRQEVPRAPPPTYSQSVTQQQGRRPDGSSGVITAVPIRDGRPVPRTQNPLQAYGSSSTLASVSIYDNLSDISQDENASQVGTKREADKPGAAGPPLKKPKKTPKFKCKECNQMFNHEWLIKEHVQMFHKFKHVESCIIRTAGSSVKGSSTCSEPDVLSPVNLAVEKVDGISVVSPVRAPVSEARVQGRDETATTAATAPGQEELIDLTIDDNVDQTTTAASKGEGKKPAQPTEDRIDPETRKIREILMKMPSKGIKGLFHIAKNIREFAGGSAAVIGNQPSAHQTLRPGNSSTQQKSDGPASSPKTPDTPVPKSLMNLQQQTEGSVTSQQASHGTTPTTQADNAVATESTSEVLPKTSTSRLRGAREINWRQQIGMGRTWMVAPPLAGETDEQLKKPVQQQQQEQFNQQPQQNQLQLQKQQQQSQQPGQKQIAHQDQQHSKDHQHEMPPPQQQHMPTASEECPTASTQAQPSSTSTSQQTPHISGRPENSYRSIDLNKHRIMGEMLDFPKASSQDAATGSDNHGLVDPNSKEHQKDSTVSREDATRNRATNEERRSQLPGNRPIQRLVGMERHYLLGPELGVGDVHQGRGPRVVIEDRHVTMGQFQQRLNELITITQPNKHGWNVQEFQEKFAEYLMAHEERYKMIAGILQNKKILGKRFPSLDQFKQIVANDMERLEEVRTKEPGLTQVRVEGETLLPDETHNTSQSQARVTETNESEVRVPTSVQIQTQLSPIIQSQPSPIAALGSASKSIGMPCAFEASRTTSDSYHHPHSGQCTLRHPPGEACPVNIWEQYHEFRGITKKPVERTHKCHVCGESFSAFWKKETHLEEVHGIAMPTLPVVATSGTTDKTGEIVPKRKTLEPRKVCPPDVEGYTPTVASRKSLPGPENLQITGKELAPKFPQNEDIISKIPQSVIEVLNREPPPLPTIPKKQQESPPVGAKSTIRGALFSSSTTAIPRTPSTEAVSRPPSTSTATHTSSSTAVVPSSANAIEATTTTKNFMPPPKVPATFTSRDGATKVTTQSRAADQRPKIAFSRKDLASVASSLSSIIAGQNYLQGTGVPLQSNPASIRPGVTHLQEVIQTAAAAAMRRIVDTSSPDGAKPLSYSTTASQQTVVTSTQATTPIPTTLPITQTRPTNVTSLDQGSSSSPTKNAVMATEANSESADSDVEYIETLRPSGLKLVVPQGQPREKPKTVRTLIIERDGVPPEGAGEKGASAFDSNVDMIVGERRRRGRPTRAFKRILGNAKFCNKCHKEETNVRGEPHKCLVHFCIWCDKYCDTAQQLMTHVKEMHPKKHVYECEVCHKGFNVKGTLERHMFVHSKKKEYKCNICKLAFTQSNNLKRHIAIHTGQKAFKCGECDKAFTSKYNLSQHLSVHFPKRTTYTCRFCKKTFLFSRTRDKHEFTHFGFTELQCSKCFKKFPSLKSLEAHIDIYHEGVGEAEAAYYDYADDAVSKAGSDVTATTSKSATSVGASSVISEVSEKSDSVAVDKPKQGASSLANEKTPPKKEGTSSMTSNKKQRKHVCPICHQNFFFLLHLKEHMQSHKDPNSDFYECTICDKRFSNSETFRAHTDTHSPLHCSECDETFKFDTQLAQHKLTEHRNGNGTGHGDRDSGKK